MKTLDKLKEKRELLFNLFLSFCLFLLSTGASFLIFQSLGPRGLLSPVSLSPKVLAAHVETSPKEVIGFLPFWNIDEEANFRYDTLSQVIYMGIEFDQEGKVVQYQDDYIYDILEELLVLVLF